MISTSVSLMMRNGYFISALDINIKWKALFNNKELL